MKHSYFAPSALLSATFILSEPPSKEVSSLDSVDIHRLPSQRSQGHEPDKCCASQSVRVHFPKTSMAPSVFLRSSVSDQRHDCRKTCSSQRKLWVKRQRRAGTDPLRQGFPNVVTQAPPFSIGEHLEPNVISTSTSIVHDTICSHPSCERRENVALV